ncbi:MAG: hypothetical protein IJC27_09880 [Lentisphaeria bacterium]|nr:hypothetical protein [Lentisphaeria bacterium]
MIEIMKLFHTLARLLTLGLDMWIFRKFYDGYTGTPHLATLPFWANGIATVILCCMTVIFSYNQSALEVGLIYFWLTITFINVLLYIRQVFKMPTVMKKLIYFGYMLAFSALIGYLSMRLFAILVIIMVICLLIMFFCKAMVWSVANDLARRVPVQNINPSYELSNGAVVHHTYDNVYHDGSGAKYIKQDDLFYKVD